MSGSNDSLDPREFKLAIEAMEKAYAPYSKFTVGAVIRAANGRLYSGCNVENAAYPQGCCAEASAISAMVMDGERRIVAITIVGRGRSGHAIPVTPCGGCRQRIREFSNEDTVVHSCAFNGVVNTRSLGELLPFSFGPDSL